MRFGFLALAAVATVAYVWLMVAMAAGRRRPRLDYADAVVGQLDREQTAALYHLCQLTVRQLEQVQRADALMPFLTEAMRQENERLIGAFYSNELPKGE